MHRRHRGHQRHMRPRLPRQWGDLARVVHADLDHCELCLAWHPRQGERHAPVIVIAGDSRMASPLIRQHAGQHLLGRGLANRSGDRNHTRPRARPRHLPQPFKCRLHVLDNQQGRIRSNTFRAMGHQGRCGPLCQRLRHKVMAVARSLKGHKKISSLQRAGINGNATDLPVPMGLTARCSCRLCRSPKRAHTDFPSKIATARLACSTSSKGKTSVPTI